MEGNSTELRFTWRYVLPQNNDARCTAKMTLEWFKTRSLCVRMVQ